MKLDLISRMVGANYHGFTTRIESRGAHGYEEKWNARDMGVLIGSDLLVDKNPTSYVHRCIMIAWVKTPSTPPFIG
jgi:hypothetical protein